MPTLKLRDENGAMQEIASLKGSDGVTPHIGENGNWYFAEEDSGITAEGNTGVFIGNVEDAPSNIDVFIDPTEESDVPFYDPIAATADMTQSVGVDQHGQLYTKEYNYNPVSKTSDMTQAVGVDGAGQLYTKTYNYNPVAKTGEMTQTVGVDNAGQLFTKAAPNIVMELTNGILYITYNE